MSRGTGIPLKVSGHYTLYRLYLNVSIFTRILLSLSIFQDCKRFHIYVHTRQVLDYSMLTQN